MKSFVLTLIALAGLSTVAMAQAKPAAPKFEASPVQLGVVWDYSHVKDAGWMNGAGADVAFRVAKPWFGVAANVSWDRANIEQGGEKAGKMNYLTFAGGPRFTYRQSKYAAFGEALFGMGHVTQSANAGFVLDDGSTSASTTKFAWQVGGGFDYKMSPRVSLRLPQVHWQRISYGGGANDNIIKLGFGFVFGL
ncbi:MAG: porin family protein [Acidobacteriaceae bacterium]|nr:porin family protein [Acidobacteriaceae bacterium]